MLLRKFLSPLGVSSRHNSSSSGSSNSHDGSSGARSVSVDSARSSWALQLHEKDENNSFECKEARELPQPPQIPDKDRFAHWYLHHTFQRRSYQCAAVREALFQNTLISIPHGFGRKYVAGAVMLNFFKWFPEGKVVFVSSLPSAVTKQSKLCRKFGIEKKFIAVLTTDVSLEERIALWQVRRAIFVSPTLLQNDLRIGAYDCRDLRCIVFDDSQKRTLGITSTLARVNASLASAGSPKSNDEDTDDDTPATTTTTTTAAGFYRTVVFSDFTAAPAAVAASLFQQGVVSHAECYVERDPYIVPYYSEGAKVLLVTRTTPQVRAVCQALDERFVRYHLGALHRAGITFKAGPAGEVCGDAARVMKIICATKAALPHMHRMDLYTLYALFSCRDTLLVNGPTSFLAFVTRMGDVSYVAKYCNFHTRRDWAEFVEFCKETLAPPQQKHLQVPQSTHRRSSSSQKLCSRSPSPSSSYSSLSPSRGFGGSAAAAPSVSPHPKLSALENLLRKHFRKCPGCKRAVVLTHFEESRQDILRWLGGLGHIVRVEGDGGSGSSCGMTTAKASLPCVVVVLESKSAHLLSGLCESDNNNNGNGGGGAAPGQRALVVCFEYESFASVRVQCSGIKSAAKVVALAAPGEQEAVSRRLGELGAAEKRASLAKLYSAIASGGGSGGTVLGQPSPRMVPSSVTSPSLCVLRGNNGVSGIDSANSSGAAAEKKKKKAKKRKRSGGDNGKGNGDGEVPPLVKPRVGLIV